MTWFGPPRPPNVLPIEWCTRLHSEKAEGAEMTNPHLMHAMAETYRTETHQQASRRQLAAEARRTSLWTRLISRQPARQPVPGPVASPVSSIAGS